MTRPLMILQGFLEEFAQSGFINIVGGCCGTTPDHIAALVRKAEAINPRSIPTYMIKQPD